MPGIGGDPAYAEALRGMVDREFCNSQKFSDQQGRALKRGALPEVLEFERKLIKRMRKLGVPLFAHCVVRSDAEQNAAFVRGVSKAKAGESPHNFGCAVDLIHGTKGWELTRKQWDLIGHVGNELAKSLGVPITWGGAWSFYDPAHWELTDWKALRDCAEAGGVWDVRKRKPLPRA